MISKFTHPYNGSVLFIQRRSEVADFVARQPRPLPVAPPVQTHLNPKVVTLALRLLLIVFILIMLGLCALWFFMAGEDSQRVRPELTPAQRAAAFRIPHTQK
jgi:hypothetical protein